MLEKEEEYRGVEVGSSECSPVRRLQQQSTEELIVAWSKVVEMKKKKVGRFYIQTNP